MLTIEQLAGARRRVELDTDDLPDQGVESGVEQRLATSWAPGAAQPVVQILGPRHLPMVLRGTWDQATTRFEDPLSVVQAVAAIVADGHRVRLVWGEVWRREGVITRFTPRWEMESLVTWELELEVHDAEAGSSQALRLRAQQTRADTDAAAIGLGAVGTAAVSTQKLVAAATWLGGLDP